VGWKVTVRHGSEVERDKAESLDRALELARGRVDAIRREGRLQKVSAFRDYGPEERVHARVEVSGPGLLRRTDGGIDVMGDGSLVPYTGAISKRILHAEDLDQAIERLREELA
jgi:hypothetical protein